MIHSRSHVNNISTINKIKDLHELKGYAKMRERKIKFE